MTDPVQKSYIQVPTQLIERISSIRIAGEQMQVFFVIMRKTIGWNKTSDGIPLSQFEELTHLKKPNIIRALEKLNQKKIIIINKKSTAPWNIYSINTDYAAWQAASKKTPAAKQPAANPKPKTPARARKKAAAPVEIPEWIDPDIWAAYLDIRRQKNKKTADVPSALRRIIAQLDRFRAAGHDPNDILDRSVINGWMGVFPPQDQASRKNADAKKTKNNQDVIKQWR